MAKFYGPVGYSVLTETRPGYHEDVIKEVYYQGDTLRNIVRWTPSQDSTNDDLNINNQISIVADQFANNHIHDMRYVRFVGANWKITSVEPRPPRLILTLGGCYRGPKANTGE